MIAIKTVITIGPILFGYAGVLQMVNVFFSKCSNGGHGGAIFVNHADARCILVLCSFHQCSSGNHGGAISAENCVIFQAKMICFYNNMAYRCNSILTHTNTKVVEMNNIDESSTNKNEAGSYILATNNVSVAYLNVSNSITTVYSSGIGLGMCKYGELIKFSQISNSVGPTIFAFYGSGTFSAYSAIKMNMLNLTSIIGIVEYRSSYIESICRDCIFINVNSAPLLRCIEGGTGVISFIDCIFPFPFNPAHFPSKLQEINTFDASNPNSHHLSLFDTVECWIEPSKPITNHIPVSLYYPTFYKVTLFTNLIVQCYY